MYAEIKFRLSFLFSSTKKIYTLLYINYGDYMKGRFKRKKKFKKNILFYIILIICFIALFRIYLFRIKMIPTSEKFINNVLDNSNNYSYNNKNNIFDNIVSYINNNIFNSPSYILDSELNYKFISNKDKLVNNQNTLDLMYESNKVDIYLYSSHASEAYSTKYLEEYNILPDIIMASKMFKEKLENIGIKTVVEEGDILSYMKENNLNHAGSYIASRHFLEIAMKKYPTTKLYIDLHRDATSYNTSHTIIDNKDCAKILFVIGLENENYEKNLKVVTEINNIIVKKYPTLTRGIMKKEGAGVNGVYNQDLSQNVILIELGGNENNIDEINNTLDILSSVIGEYLNEKK